MSDRQYKRHQLDEATGIFIAWKFVDNKIIGKVGAALYHF